MQHDSAARSPVTRRPGWRGRDAGEAGTGLRPDKQNGAGGVIDDEPAGRAEALGSQAGAVTVAGEDEQVRAVGDLPFEPPAPLRRPSRITGRIRVSARTRSGSLARGSTAGTSTSDVAGSQTAERGWLVSLVEVGRGGSRYP